MTDLEMSKRFEKLYPDIKVESFSILDFLKVSGIPGIQITATNGDTFLYFPNKIKKERRNDCQIKEMSKM